MGRVLDALDELGLAANTIVIFIGDNGFMVGQHGLLGKGNARYLHVDERGRISRERGTRANMFDDSVLVPFIVRWPGVVQAGHDQRRAGVHHRHSPHRGRGHRNRIPPQVDGRSLLPLLQGEPDVAWRDAYCDTYDMIYLGDNGEKPHMRMIRTDDWKLVLYHDENGQAARQWQPPRAVPSRSRSRRTHQSLRGTRRAECPATAGIAFAQLDARSRTHEMSAGIA